MPSPLPDPAIRLPLLLRHGSPEPCRDGKLQQEVLDLFEQSRAGLLHYLRCIGVQDYDAEEVVQEVFLALFHHLRRGRDQHNLRGWVFRVAHNIGLKQLYRARRNESPEDESFLHRQVHPDPNPEQQLSAQQRQQTLLAAFRALPELDRRCLHLRSEGLRYREIAEVVGISLGSVAQSLARSLERLRRADRKS
ncbi:RNA polymerase sigma factor [Nevskia soli]|uniref:RNA polymerase sigma factor n=1 Tax=Nevskia soli TaxID=418856 RepID=UPI0015D790FF|nr:sigma-70 family RNA polymerase sigma factor [Nevskia soli]